MLSYVNFQPWQRVCETSDLIRRTGFIQAEGNTTSFIGCHFLFLFAVCHLIFALLMTFLYVEGWIYLSNVSYNFSVSEEMVTRIPRNNCFLSGPRQVIHLYWNPFSHACLYSGWLTQYHLCFRFFTSPIGNLSSSIDYVVLFTVPLKIIIIIY